MAAHRYWRIYARGATVALADVELRTAAGGATVATGGVATASAGTAAAAWDGAPGTEWSAAGSASAITTAWVQYALPAAAEVVEVALRSPAANAPTACLIAWSDDGTRWQICHPGVIPADTAGGWVTVAVSDAAPEAAVVSLAVQAVETPPIPTAPAYSASLLDTTSILAHAGTARIAGDVGIAGTPDVMVARRVRLHLRATGYLVRETWSDPVTGAYAFEDLAAAEYMVLSMDHLGVHNAVVADRIIAA